MTRTEAVEEAQRLLAFPRNARALDIAVPREVLLALVRELTIFNPPAWS